jgi:hypothetical protein
MRRCALQGRLPWPSPRLRGGSKIPAPAVFQFNAVHWHSRTNRSISTAMAKAAPLAYELNRFIYDAIVALERQIVAQQPQSKLPFVIRKVNAQSRRLVRLFLPP